MKSILIIPAFIFFSFTICAQLPPIQLAGTDSIPIPFASVLNINTGEFTYSNERGVFRLNIRIGDTLDISHISYEKKRLAISGSLRHILLHPKSIVLQDVVVTSSKKKVFYIRSSSKKGSHYGLPVDGDIAALMKNTLEDDILLRKIIIPVRFRPGYVYGGYLMAQLVKEENNMVTSTPLSEPCTVEIGSKKTKVLEIPCQGVVIPRDAKFYVVLKRVVPDTVFRAMATTYSANPFIYFSTDGKKGDSYSKFAWENSWRDTSERFAGFTPLFNIAVEAELLHEDY